MTKHAYFAMGLHFHQPVGNFPDVLEKAYQTCYKPFFDSLAEYPEIKATIHISGCLLDFFCETAPEFITKLSGLVKRGQVEMLGGGYYEPIFSAIPQCDRIGQIKTMSMVIREIDLSIIT